MTPKPNISTAGLDPLKDLFETILVRLEALESKVGVTPSTATGRGGGGSLSGASSHDTPAIGNKRMSVINSESNVMIVLVNKISCIFSRF